jgi:hypothetical protein
LSKELNLPRLNSFKGRTSTFDDENTIGEASLNTFKKERSPLIQIKEGVNLDMDKLIRIRNIKQGTLTALNRNTSFVRE